MPMDLNLVYNLTKYENRHYYTTDGKGASTGYGFMLDFQQRLLKITDQRLLNQGYDYLYIDGDGRLCGLEISINYADGQTEYHNKTFNPLLVNTRQSISFSVRPKRENQVVNNIGVTYIARKNANLTALYEMMLTVDETGTTYSYDSEGNLPNYRDGMAMGWQNDQRKTARNLRFTKLVDHGKL